jgi:hypothetical protein
MRSSLTASIAVIGSLICASAKANESSDRVELMARIDDAVHAIATSLDAPTAKKLDDAGAHGRELRDLVTRLASLKADDPRAADIVAHYPRYADTVDAAIARLKQLGGEAHRADGVADRCAKDNAALEALIKHADADATRELQILAKKAVALGSSWGPQLAELATVDASVTADLAAAHVALTDGYWMEIASNLATDAGAAAAIWTDRYQAATAACEQLAKGADHAELVPVIAALHARTATEQAASAKLVTDYNAWLVSLRGMRELALKNRAAVSAAMCGAIDGALADDAMRVAADWAHDLADATAAAMAEATRLVAHANDNPARAKAVRDGVRSNTALVAAIARDEALGRQNPKLRGLLAMIAQRREHALAGCVAKSIDIAAADCGGSACRVACIKLVDHTCTLVEPAPDTSAAKTDAFARGQRELAGLQAWYGRDKAELFAKSPAFKRCEESVAGPTLDLFADVATYNACATAPELGEALPDVGADLAP